MPLIPASQGQRVRTDVARAPQVGALDTSEATLSLARAASAVEQVIDRRAEREAQTEAWQAQDAINREFANWNAEARRARRGANAKGYADEVQTWWRKAADDHGAKMSPLAKQIANRALSAASLGAYQSALGFEEGEVEIGARSARQGAQSANVNAAVAAGPDKGAAILQAEVEETRAFAASRGLNADAEVLRLTSVAYGNMIASLVDANPAKAREVFSKFKDQIDATRHDEIDKLILKGEDGRFASDFALQHAALPYEEQLAKVGELPTGDRRRLTLQAVNEQQGQVVAAQQQRERRAHDTAWQLVGQGQRVPEAVLRQMDGRGRVELQDYLAARAKRMASGGGPVKTDPKLHATLWDAYVRNPQAFANTPLAPLAESLSKDDLEQVARAQAGLLAPPKPGKDEVSFTQKIEGTLDSLGLTDPKRDKQARGRFALMARREWESREKVSPQEEDAILARLSTQGEVLSGAWYRNDPDKRFFELEPAEREKFGPAPDDRKLIVAQLRKESGRNPTEAEILARFRLAKGF